MNYKPDLPIAWLAVTPYMHHWLFNEFGGEVMIHERPVISIHCMPEARKILRMQTQDDIMEAAQIRWSLSAMRMDCLVYGCMVGPETVEKMCNLTPETLKTFVPIECPRMALTKYGVLRPWSRQTSFGKNQAFALLKLLREMFWHEVEQFDKAMTDADGGEYHTAISMVEAFCQKNNIPDLYADELRREWQRQCNKNKVKQS